MWPLVVAAGVYIVCKGIQQGIDENAHHSTSTGEYLESPDSLYQLEDIDEERRLLNDFAKRQRQRH